MLFRRVVLQLRDAQAQCVLWISVHDERVRVACIRNVAALGDTHRQRRWKVDLKAKSLEIFEDACIEASVYAWYM